MSIWVPMFVRKQTSCSADNFKKTVLGYFEIILFWTDVSGKAAKTTKLRSISVHGLPTFDSPPKSAAAKLMTHKKSDEFSLMVQICVGISILQNIVWFALLSIMVDWSWIIGLLESALHFQKLSLRLLTNFFIRHKNLISHVKNISKSVVSLAFCQLHSQA